MPGSIFLKGERINLRTIERDDKDFLRDSINDPEVRRFLTIRRPANTVQEEKFIENWVEKRKDITILMICKDEEPLGVISLQLNMDDGKAEIGIWLSTGSQGKGYGAEASKLIIDHGFKELRLHKIFARFYEDNIVSKKLWEKLGFVKEGELREHAFIDGEYVKVYQYSILEHEWEM